jgi:autotransporter-associated beta strand protein
VSFLVEGSPGNYTGAGGVMFFENDSSAGQAAFEIEGTPPDGFPGWVIFQDDSTAGDASFLVDPDLGGAPGWLYFLGSSTGGNAVVDTRGEVAFLDNADAESTAISTSDDGFVVFSGASLAGQAVITNNVGSTHFSYSGGVYFLETSGAGSSNITNSGSTAQGSENGLMVFYDSSSADNATLIANAGTNGGEGGSIRFEADSSGGTARVQVFGNGNLDVSPLGNAISVGSIEGDGQVFLGARNLSVGANNLSTLFAGTIQDGGISGFTGGSLTKVGTGTLILTNASTYPGGTVINDGFFLVNNVSGSGTGKGTVQVNAGTLGGNGIIRGAVFVGKGSGTGAGLGPGKNSVTPGTLTIQRKLTLMRDATYKVTMNSDQVAADKVTARGVRIRGAQITLLDLGTSVLPPGTAFTVINNSATTPISGGFSNLADDSTITVGNNTFQANYEGGDGNDLTLTVVP